MRSTARREREREQAALEAREIAEETLLSPEDRALHRARRIGEEKAELASQLFPVLAIGIPLLVFIFPLGVIFLYVKGRRPLMRAWRLFVAPRVRDRFVQQEVDREVHETLHEERRQLEGEHARSMQQLSASIAHEIRNPITAAKSLVQQMEEDPTSRENVEYARVALEELQRVERSVSHLLRFARDEDMQLEVVRIADVVDSAAETFRDRLGRSAIALDLRTEQGGTLHADPEKLRRVVINLIANAVDALEEAAVAEPRIEVTAGENLAATEVWLRVKDNGPGFDAEAQRRLFAPFYTSKAHGTGLGLAICRKLVDDHGGSIEVHSQPGAGAEFLLVFPRAGGVAEGRA